MELRLQLKLDLNWNYIGLLVAQYSPVLDVYRTCIGLVLDLYWLVVDLYWTCIGLALDITSPGHGYQ